MSSHGQDPGAQYPAGQNPPPAPWPGAAPPTGPRRRVPVLAIVAIVLAAVCTVAGVVVVGGYALLRTGADEPSSWQERAARIEGIHNYRQTNPDWLTNAHRPGILTYPVSPPVGGDHNPIWQNCMGDVYTTEIAEEHAVHSLEHGAVWVTHRPDLPAEQVERLASRVREVEYLFMSPYPNLDVPISLQAWGYQLKVDDADDSRIDEFIQALRINATIEAGASCSGGVTEASPTPLDLPGGMD